jgi:hypothetical protein
MVHLSRKVGRKRKTRRSPVFSVYYHEVSNTLALPFFFLNIFFLCFTCVRTTICNTSMFEAFGLDGEHFIRFVQGVGVCGADRLALSRR